MEVRDESVIFEIRMRLHEVDVCLYAAQHEFSRTGDVSDVEFRICDSPFPERLRCRAVLFGRTQLFHASATHFVEKHTFAREQQK